MDEKEFSCHLLHNLPAEIRFPSAQNDNTERVFVLRIGLFQHFFFCYCIYRDKKTHIWNSIILRQHCQQPLPLLSPGLLDARSPFYSGRELLTCCWPLPNSRTGDKCQFGIYLSCGKLPKAEKALALSALQLLNFRS